MLKPISRDSPIMFGGAQILEMQKYVSAHHNMLISEESLENYGKDWMQTYYQEKRGRTDNKQDAKKRVSNINSAPKNFVVPLGIQNLAPRPQIKRLGLEPDDGVFMEPKILGTASAKLTYLLDSILLHVSTEKTLIFYESENVAWYIAQALEIYGIQYLAYQKNLPGPKKAQYIVTFHDSQIFRVLLMDLSQAAHGLNICSASRVYFVNPVWTPSIEAQALKRAHRIGQNLPVYAETLILQDTLEEEMLKRRNSMSDRELKDTHDSVVNDSQMRDIISNLKFLNTKDEVNEIETPAVSLATPEKLFGASKRGGVLSNPNEFLVAINNPLPSFTPLVTRKRRRSDDILVSDTNVKSKRLAKKSVRFDLIVD
jgi:superfamily II DNA or RNA helicase